MYETPKIGFIPGIRVMLFDILFLICFISIILKKNKIKKISAVIFYKESIILEVN